MHRYRRLSPDLRQAQVDNAKLGKGRHDLRRRAICLTSVCGAVKAMLGRATERAVTRDKDTRRRARDESRGACQAQGHRVTGRGVAAGCRRCANDASTMGRAPCRSPSKRTLRWLDGASCAAAKRRWRRAQRESSGRRQRVAFAAFRGRPPIRPLARAAAAFASVDTTPPVRPMAAAQTLDPKNPWRSAGT